MKQQHRRPRLSVGDKVRCVSGYLFRNGRANQTGTVVAPVLIKWDDNSGTEEMNPNELEVMEEVDYTARVAELVNHALTADEAAKINRVVKAIKADGYTDEEIEYALKALGKVLAPPPKGR